MTTSCSLHPKHRFVLSALACALAALTGRASADDDVSYGKIPPAEFGAVAAAPGAEDGHDDVARGATPCATVSTELAPADDALALAGHDDVSYPAGARPDGAAAIASSGVAEGAEVRASAGKDAARVKVARVRSTAPEAVHTR